jgi:hypothetical protein
MKRHITREQLAEISLEQANVLSEMLGYSEENKLVYEQIPYILTIDKMIEIIKNNKNNKRRLIIEECEDDKWFISGIGETLENFGDFKHEELIDALWKVVKFVLKKPKTK